jgi:AcrR family transcriptional regulator
MFNMNKGRQQDRRSDILTCFERLVAKYGVDKTTMRDIARQMGLSVGTLYNEFKDKEDLVTAMMKRELDHFIAELLQKEKAATTLEEKLYILTVVRTKMMNDALKNNQPLFEYLMREPRTIKYIGMTFGKQRSSMDAIILQKLEDVLVTAKMEKIIAVEDPKITAHILFDAFHAYYAPPEITQLSQGERIQYAEVMYRHLVISLMMKEPATG